MKIHKKWLIIILAFLGLGGAGAYYLWKEFTAVPDWYATQTTENNIKEVQIKEEKREENFSSSLEAESSQNQSRETPPTQPAKQQEFNQIINHQLSENQRVKPFLEASEEVRTRVDKNQLEMGTVIQPSAISRDDIKSSEKEILERAMSSFPRLSQQKVYVGISGDFEVDDNGEVILNDNTKVRIGNMNLSLEEVSRRLGVSPETVKQKLQANLQQLPVENQSGSSD